MLRNRMSESEWTLEDIRYRCGVVNALLELRKSGQLFGVWVDGWNVSIQDEMYGEIIKISWHEACSLVGYPTEAPAVPLRKSPASVMITEREKRTA